MTQTSSATATRVTRFTKFFTCNPGRDALFAVNGDIPLENALEQAFCFLEAAESVIYTLVMESESAEDPVNKAWPALYMVQMCHAIVEAAMNEAIARGRRHD